MSGPWDRPSSPSPGDQDWPAEDLESAPSSQPPADPWSSDDPWQESTRDPSPGWDVWPPPAPAPDDYLAEEPEPPVSDPWAESWTDEIPDMPSAADASPAAPSAEPSAEAPRVTDARRVEPWAPEPDPWGAASVDPWIPAQPVELPREVAEAEPEPEPEPKLEPEPEPPKPEPEPRLEPEAALEIAPDVDAEPTEAELEPAGDGVLPAEERPIEPVWESDAELSVEHEAEPEPEPEPAPAIASRAEPEGERDWQPDPWPDHADATQVLPTDWTPPPSPVRDVPAELEPSTGDIRTALATRDMVGAEDELVARPSTVEQAVPWLIGVILLLAGMVIVLLALIFAGDASLGGAAANPSGIVAGLLPSSSGIPSEEPNPSPPVESAAASASARIATAEPVPEYGALEMVYQGRSAALAPIYLLRHDFTTSEDPSILAQDANLDVRRFAWAPDGRVGAGLLADVLVSIEPGSEKRRLGDGISTLTFGDDASTLYAVRVTLDGANDVATVLAIDFLSGNTSELASISYARPTIGAEEALAEAQFGDDGGTVRVHWMEDDTLRLWSLGAGTWAISTADGEVTEMEESQAVLWSASGRHRIALEVDGGTTTIRQTNREDADLASTSVEGLVSHLRWSPDGERVVFTLGRSATGGGVLQDLFLWDLADGEAPTQLTSTGAAFGAEWLGSQPRWED